MIIYISILYQRHEDIVKGKGEQKVAKPMLWQNGALKVISLLY